MTRPEFQEFYIMVNGPAAYALTKEQIEVQYQMYVDEQINEIRSW